MLNETSLKTYEITVSLNSTGELVFWPDADVEAGRGDHIVWKSIAGDLVLAIRGAEDKGGFARRSPFVRYVYADGRPNGQGESRVSPQVRGNAEPGTYKYSIFLFDDQGEKHELDPRIVIR